MAAAKQQEGLVPMEDAQKLIEQAAAMKQKVRDMGKAAPKELIEMADAAMAHANRIHVAARRQHAPK